MSKEKRPAKKISPAVWGILAAVLVFAVLAAGLIARSRRAQEETFSLPPMVYVGGIRYLYERDITEEAPQLEAEMQRLGEITSVIAETEYVAAEFQANFSAMGDAVCRWEEYIILYHGEEIWLMRPMAEVQTEVFPQ